MLNLELDNHTEFAAFLDLEWLVLESCFATLGGEINGDGVASGGLHG